MSSSKTKRRQRKGRGEKRDRRIKLHRNRQAPGASEWTNAGSFSSEASLLWHGNRRFDHLRLAGTPTASGRSSLSLRPFFASFLPFLCVLCVQWPLIYLSGATGVVARMQRSGIRECATRPAPRNSPELILLSPGEGGVKRWISVRGLHGIAAVSPDGRAGSTDINAEARRSPLILLPPGSRQARTSCAVISLPSPAASGR